MISNVFVSSGRISRRQSFSLTAPREPPIISRTGFSPLKPQADRPFSLSPSNNSLRMGVPVCTPLPFGTYCRVSGKVAQITLAEGIAILFARPGVMSDSWIITGMWFFFAPSTTGTATKPPLENTKSGFNFFNRRFASLMPFSTLNTSLRFSLER